MPTKIEEIPPLMQPTFLQATNRRASVSSVNQKWGVENGHGPRFSKRAESEGKSEEGKKNTTQQTNKQIKTYPKNSLRAKLKNLRGVAGWLSCLEPEL